MGYPLTLFKDYGRMKLVQSKRRHYRALLYDMLCNSDGDKTDILHIIYQMRMLKVFKSHVLTIMTLHMPANICMSFKSFIKFTKLQNIG